MQNIQFEVRKANCIDFEEAIKITMRVEGAFAGVLLDSPSKMSTSSGPVRIVFENTEFWRSGRSKQRLLDIRNNACFKCHEPGCRLWRYPKREAHWATVANIEAMVGEENRDVDLVSDSSEN